MYTNFPFATHFFKYYIVGYNNNQTQRGDFGLQGGLGVMFKGVVIDIRYGYGLANISNTPNNIGTVKNTAISATLGYAIPLGSK